MPRYLLVFGLLLVSASGWAQSKFFVKAGVGPSIPLAIFEDEETQDDAALAKTGTNLALTFGRDFRKNFGISISGAMWENSVDTKKANERAVDLLKPFVQEVIVSNVSSDRWKFATVYASPHGTIRVGEGFRLDLRINAGLIWSRYPGSVSTGTITDPRIGSSVPFSVLTEPLRATSFVYGGGISGALRISQQFHVFVDADGLRSRPDFPESRITAGLNRTSGAIDLSRPRSEFRQKVGTLSVRLGAGLFF